MIFFRTGLIAALLIGLGALGGQSWAQYDAPLYPPAPVSPSQPIPLNPDRAVRDPVAPTDATGPSRIDSRNGDSRNMAALPPEVRAYARRWGLATEEVANHLLRFLKEPTSRTYVVTYDAGLELCRAWVGDDPTRFRTLLTEQVRVRDLLAAPRA